MERTWMTAFIMSTALIPAAGCEEVEDAQGCELRTWYVDADGDGWGDAGLPGQDMCAPDCVYRATNQLDCDDSDPNVTAQTGAWCPDEIAGDDAGFQTYVGHLNEYLVVFGASGLADAVVAESSCRDWGGDLAVWKDPVELWDVLALVEVEPSFAGFVGIAPKADGGWSWTQASPLVIDSIGFCDGAAPTATDATDRLAVVKRSDAWCIGAPEQADAAPYGVQAHYICARPKPFAEDYD